MRIEAGPIDGIFIITPKVFGDDRGFFFESFRKDIFQRETGLDLDFVQDNHSRSVKDVVRGLHFQWDPPMGKFMRVSRGRGFLVAVDIRKDSPTVGQWYGIEVSDENKLQVYAPAGFARGFAALSDMLEVQYKCTGIHSQAGESGILWRDPEIGIKWPVADPILSEKDRDAQTLAQWLERPESDNFMLKHP